MPEPITEPIFVDLTRHPIETQPLLDSVVTPEAGAAVLFLGTTRNQTGGRATESLDYEAYESMALSQLQELARAAHQRWELSRLAVVHRLGRLQLTEASVAIAVSAPHREAAFSAGKWLIDELKRVVPIWKKENWADGDSEWVMPGVNRLPRGESHES